MKVLVLGNNGMLGHMVDKYLTRRGEVVFTMPPRDEVPEAAWPNKLFKESILTGLNGIDYIVNCIGAIPQHKKHNFESYISTNVTLPIWLAKNVQCKIIHPTTDCEFSGNISENLSYYKEDVKDARDDYGLSKAMASQVLEWFPNVKQIRTSIFGPELKGKVSILEWFLSQTGEVNGYTNHFWNGITTLEWARLAHGLMYAWDTSNKVTQVGTDPIPKIKLLELINKVYGANKKIIPKESVYCNKCLRSDLVLPSLEEQLVELKNYES